MSNLTSIELVYNCISVIEPKAKEWNGRREIFCGAGSMLINSGPFVLAFGDLSSMEELNLSCNKLSVVCQDDFGCLANLELLRLNHNEISIQPKAFGNLRNLKQLSLDLNNLSAVSEENFANLANLEWLDLS